jgi:hypothetical protein
MVTVRSTVFWDVTLKNKPSKDPVRSKVMFGCLLRACYLIGSIFDTANGDNIFLRHYVQLLPKYTESHPRLHYSFSLLSPN